MTVADPDRLLTLGDGRALALDDRGDPGGVPVVYFHGTPDSRLARHPDDGLARELGVRLIAPDRPGIGRSDNDPERTPERCAADVASMLDLLGIERAGVLAWSAGSIPALAFAGRHPDRVSSVVLASPLVPADAYADPGVLEGADDARRLFAEAMRTTTPDELGPELAPWLVPPELDDASARTLFPGSIAAVATIPGADAQLVSALVASVTQGLSGIERDLVAQATPLGAVLDDVPHPVSVHVGADDDVTPPVMARWLGDRLGASVHVHDGVGHALAILEWSRLLGEAAGR